MSTILMNYLQREHARLEGEIAAMSRHPVPDQLHLARLKKLKLAVKDEMTRIRGESGAIVAA